MASFCLAYLFGKWYDLCQKSLKLCFCCLFVWQFPLKTISFVKKDLGRLGLDRGSLWRHFASCTFSENGIIFVRIPDLGFFVGKDRNRYKNTDNISPKWMGEPEM